MIATASTPHVVITPSRPLLAAWGWNGAVEGIRIDEPIPYSVAPQPARDRQHGPDFRNVVWDGVAYSLTATQAAVVRVLWEAHEQGTPEVGQSWLLAEVESGAARLRDLFREGAGREAWGTLVVMARPGVYRLAPPRPA